MLDEVADRPSERLKQRPDDGIFGLLADHARRDPAAAAILGPGRKPLAYGALLDQLDSIRKALNNSGLGRRDRVALITPRGPDAAVAALGVAGACTCVLLSADAPADELEAGLRQTRAKAVLVSATAGAEVKRLASRLGIDLLLYSSAEGSPAGQIEIEGGRRTTAARPGLAQQGDIAFVLRTSGTTRSKVVPLTHGTMFARANLLRRMLGVTPSDRCLNLMSVGYHHGLAVGLMTPLTAGGSAVYPPAFDRSTFFACMQEFRPTWYTGSFTYHQAIFEWLEKQPKALDGHRLRFLRAASGPMPRAAHDGLERLLGVPLLECYGTTEAGTLVSNSLDEVRKPGLVGRPLGDHIAIMDDHGRILSPGRPGEVVVRGPIVFDGYEGDPDANQRAFRGEWYRTGDQAVVDEDGYLKLIGRMDEIINRGGEKIVPAEVDSALLAHDAVAQAVSFPVPHPRLGHDIAAAIVPRSGASVTAQELRRLLATRIAPFKIPRVVIVTTALPKGPTGKINRASLASHFGLDRATRHGAKRPEPPSKVYALLLNLWRDVLGREDIDCDSDFFQQGGDSISAVDLLQRIEKEIQYEVPLALLLEAPTVNEFMRRLETSNFSVNDSLVRINTGGTRRPLFGVAGRGGHVTRLQPIMRSLGPDQPCYGLQPPGMDWEQAGCETIPEMAAHYIREMKTVQPNGPYRFLGDSFGGLVVFEIALQLQRQGDAIELLAMVDTNPPGCLTEGGANLLPPVPNVGALPQVSDSHLRARCSYVLDSRLKQNRLIGELKYFVCDGNPIIAGADPRRLWREFAPDGLRLLHLPGLHGYTDIDPQRGVLQRNLRDLLEGRSLDFDTPTNVFEQSYRIESVDRGERIVGSTGDTYQVEHGNGRGFVEQLDRDIDTIQVRGWAVEHNQREPAHRIAVFMDGQFVGYGASGEVRYDIATRQGAPSALGAGFNFLFNRHVIKHPEAKLRLFILSDGCASELPFAVEFELAAAQSELACFENELATIRSALGGSEAKLASTKATHASLQATHAGLQNKLANSQAYLTSAQSELTRLQAELANLRQSLRDMETSTSWRITEPLRALRRVLLQTLGRWRGRTGP